MVISDEEYISEETGDSPEAETIPLPPKLPANLRPTLNPLGMKKMCTSI